MYLPARNTTTTQRRLLRAGSLALTAAALLLAGGAFLAPWLASRGSAAALPLYRFYSHICHQDPARSFAFFGHPAAACGRCLGIYLGFLAGCLAFPFFRSVFQPRLPRPRTFFLMSLPLAIDVLANLLRIWDWGNGFRLATGLVWGLILPFFALAGLSDLVLRKLAFPPASP